MQKKRIAALGGDGIGPEVVGATCHILEQAGFDIDIAWSPSGESALEEYGTVLPDETKALCESSDAILFGSVNPPSDPIIMYLRWGLGNYVNVRPTRYYPGANSPPARSVVGPEIGFAAVLFASVFSQRRPVLPGQLSGHLKPRTCAWHPSVSATGTAS